MIEATNPQNEKDRLKALQRYKILDTEAETLYDDITKLASLICNTPISLITLIDDSRQWFKSKIGFDADESARETSFCGHVIHNHEVMIVNDATKDQRFFDNPSVVGNPNIKFYAGAPLITPDGYALGSLCVVDRVVRELSREQIEALESLARQVSANFELRLLNEHLDQVVATKNKFFSILAHDLRGPFSVILGFSELLKDELDGLDKVEIADYVDSISRSADRAYNLMQGLLEWSMHETGTMSFDPTEFKIDEVCQEVVDLLAASASKKLILLNYLSNPVTVLADKNMLNSVIRNLVSNALKFTPSGGNVQISTNIIDRQVEIQIKDNGVGIEPEDLKKLFSLAANHTTRGTEDEKGSGLGLILCSGFIEKHGSKLQVDSEVGVGTTFKFRVPLV